MLNFREHVLEEFQAVNVDSYFILGGKLNQVDWRTVEPEILFESINNQVAKRLAMPTI